MADVERHRERLEDHDSRITNLERWRARVEGALATLAFILGSGGVIALGIEVLL